jgi:hypothetical protein
MKTNLAIFALLFAASLSAPAQEPTHKDPLLDRLTGSWILQGTIAGHETTHDIESEWVLNHEYLRFHETSREKNAQGQPAYEAIVFIEWDKSSNQYQCLWLDSTAGGGLSAPIAHGKRGIDEITFLFRDKDKDDKDKDKDKDKDSGVQTTFAYNKGADTWSWLIDNESAGKLTSFARVKLTRK